MKGFISFIREQGVMGLAVGFLLGGAVSKMVTSLVNDLINPLVGIFLGRAGALTKVFFQIGSVKLMWGDFLNSFIDFTIITFVVYFGVKILKLDKLDKKKGI